MEEERARHEQEIQVQKEQSARLGRECDLLVQEQKLLREQIEQIRRQSAEPVAS